MAFVGGSRISAILPMKNMGLETRGISGANNPGLIEARAAYPGVFDIGDSHEPGKPEVRLLLPTLLETSAQARFLIPMTLSLSAGLLVGMAASLVLTPVRYAMVGGGIDQAHIAAMRGRRRKSPH